MKAPCEHPDHVGYKLVDRRDLVERRMEWRDVVTQARFRTITLRHECKECVRTELDIVKTMQGSLL